MTYIVQRKSRFYVVAYDGIDPITGREQRRWHPAGHSRADAEAIAANLDCKLAAVDTATTADPLTVARYLNEQWLPIRRHDLDPSTAHRYVEPVIAARLGVSTRTVWRWRASGLTAHQADRAAIAAGWHPGSIWDTWWSTAA